MDEETPFLDAIRANQEDRSIRLVYADWLEERGHSARSEYLRVDDELQKLMDSGLRSEQTDQPKLRRLHARLKTLGKALDPVWVAIFDALRPKIFRCRICHKVLFAKEAIDTNPHSFRRMKTTRYCTLCYEDAVRSQMRRGFRDSTSRSGSAERDYNGGPGDDEY